MPDTLVFVVAEDVARNPFDGKAVIKKYDVFTFKHRGKAHELRKKLLNHSDYENPRVGHNIPTASDRVKVRFVERGALSNFGY